MIAVLHVDAFASTPFTGNPAAVCLLREERSADWMQAVGRELNLPATAFVTPRPDGFALRWFTPTTELELCGHGTLASAHALWETGALPKNEPARFHTQGGLLTAIQRDGWIELDFPAVPEEPATPPADVLEGLGLGVAPRYVGRSSLDYLVELDSEEAVRAIRPDFRRLATIPVRGFIVTSRAHAGADDFVSRFFCPARGIDEDAVTGSAHCCLATFWSHRLAKQTFAARQLSARGGALKVTLDGERVRLAGQAMTISRGELSV